MTYDINKTENNIPYKKGASLNDSQVSYDPDLKTINTIVSIQAPAGRVLWGQDVSQSNNGGFISIKNEINSTEGLVPFRVFNEITGTDDGVSVVLLDPSEFGVFQSLDDETLIIPLDGGYSFVFTQLVDAFNYSHKLRGAFGKMVFNLDVARDPNDDNILTDQQLIDLPQKDKIRIVNSEIDFSDIFDFDSPDNPLDDEDQGKYFTAKDFAKDRKLIITLLSQDGNPLTMLGHTFGGVFIPYFGTTFSNRYIETIYPNDDTIVSNIHTWSSQQIQNKLDEKIDDAANVGGFAEVFRDEILTTLNFRTLQNSDGNLTITQNANDVDIVLNPTYGNMYQKGNTTATTIGTKDVFEDVVNFIEGETDDVSFLSSVLTTNVAGMYAIDYSACVDSSTGNTFETAIEIDGIIRDESFDCSTIGVGSTPNSLSGTFIRPIGASIGVKLVIRNITNANNATVVHASVVIKRIGQ